MSTTQLFICFLLKKMLKPLRSHEPSMGKKRSWFGLMKRLFAAKQKTKDKNKSRGWSWFLPVEKPKLYYPTILAPQRTINEVREEQRKQAVAVAVAMAAAADAAVAAARAASEVVHLTSNAPQSFEEYKKRTRFSAATKIQSAYRAHLARKALKALKGLVRLQALVRGRIVRRQIFTKLSCLRRSPPTLMTQPQIVHQIRVPNTGRSYKDYNDRQVFSLKEELEEERKKLRCNSLKTWDQSLILKEDMEGIWLRKQEASLKRERMKRYSFSHREVRNDRDLETLSTSHFDRKKETPNSRSYLDSNSVSIAMNGATRLKLKNTPKKDLLEELKFPFTLPRRSFCHAKQKSFGDESSLPNSPNFPTYMSSTESAKAKIRSTSTSRQRLGIFDSCADFNSPYKARLSTWSTFNGDFGSSNGRRYGTEQISISMNGFH